MSRSTQLAARFKEVIINGKLIAFTNYKDQLADLTLEQAMQRIDGLNSIAALTFHVNYYVKGVLDVLIGGDLTIRDKYSFDMPKLEKEKDWEELRASLFNNSESFIEAITLIPESKWNEPFVKEEYGSYQRNIEAMVEHCYYHLGQIVIIKKMVLKA